MTLEQAIQLLDQASSHASLTRADHQRVLQAVETIKSLINKDDEED